MPFSQGIVKEGIVPIITISRGSYSRGKEIAEVLAKELHYECLSRDILVEASNQFNIPEIKLVKALHDSPSVLERFSHGQEKYVSYFKSSFLSHIALGNIVYHGLAGHFFLQNISHVLKVRINAKMSNRVKEEMKREKCMKEAALYNLKKDDEERRKWSLQLYGQDTWDSRLYDMVFCFDSLTVTDIVEILIKTIKKKQFQETQESIAELQKRVLLANIHARIIPLSPSANVKLLDNYRLEITNIDGRLKNDKGIRQDLISMMQEEFNVQEVIYKEQVQPYKGHINPFYNIDTH